MAKKKTPFAGRFWAKVDKRGPDECWIWQAAVNKVTGYGTTTNDGRTMGAHRAAYLLAVGPIPEGLTLDHSCNVRTCVNPAHLSPCTTQVNTALAVERRKACRRGHSREGNIYLDPNGTARCRPCNTLKAQEYRLRKAARTAA